MRLLAWIACVVLGSVACGDDGGAAGGGGGGAASSSSVASTGGGGDAGAGGGDPCDAECTEALAGTVCPGEDEAGCPADRVCGASALAFAWEVIPPADGAPCSVDGLLCYYEAISGDAGGYSGHRAVCADDATWSVTSGACDLDAEPIDACTDGPSCLYATAPCPVFRRCGDDDFPPPEGSSCDTLAQTCDYARTAGGDEASTTATCTESGWTLGSGGAGGA